MNPASAAAAAAAARRLYQVVAVGFDAHRRQIYVGLVSAGLLLLLGILVQVLVGDEEPLAPLATLLPAAAISVIWWGIGLLAVAVILIPAVWATASPRLAGGPFWPPASLVLAGPCGGQERPPRLAWA